MKCIIIEDQPPAQRILKKYIEDIGTLQLVATFSDAIQAMEYLKTGAVDLIFLDIHLPRMSGIDMLRMVPNLPPVILTTAFADYALESYEFRVVDYLLKPFSFQRFVKAVSRVPLPYPPKSKTETVKTPDSPSEIFIKSGYEYIRIGTGDIVYIKSDADYTELYLAEKKYLSSEPLKHWLETLDGDRFVQVHRSFIINVAQIVKVVGNQLYMSDQSVVPIGRAFKEEFAERFLS